MIYFLISSAALAVIGITMLCRANDLRWRAGMKWQARLTGFILAGTMPIGIIIVEWVTEAWPSPYETVCRIGLALVFLTTPHLPPWWKWISGREDADGTN